MEYSGLSSQNLPWCIMVLKLACFLHIGGLVVVRCWLAVMQSAVAGSSHDETAMIPSTRRN
jgi:hypothetical protein